LQYVGVYGLTNAKYIADEHQATGVAWGQARWKGEEEEEEEEGEEEEERGDDGCKRKLNPHSKEHVSKVAAKLEALIAEHRHMWIAAIISDPR
jgi:TATA-binding protein-associated factor Taf7